MKKVFAYIIIVVAILTSCSPGEKKYKIGVSQCSEDIWRDKQNAELRMGAYFHDNVELRFAAAYDSDDRQVQQIDSLVATGIDLLIVAPNQVQTISPAIDRAYDKGIPVIVFERKTSSQKYTAFMSADNYEMGRVMGEHIASRLHGQGRVMEIMGLKGSSPAIERHNGFMDALKGYPSIVVVDTLQGDWTEESAYEATKQWLSQQSSLQPIDFVFAQNDRMAMGARKAVANSSLFTFHSSLTKYCGIDGLPGEDGGIRLVRDSILDATYIYPTHGDRLIQLAVDILEGKPYEKEVRLMSALVTHDNANVLLMQNDEIMRQSDYLDQLHHRADNYLAKLDTQRVILWMAFGVIALLVLSIILFYRYHIGKITLRRERVVNTVWNMTPADPDQHPSPAPSPKEDSTEPAATKQADEESRQIPPQAGQDDESPTTLGGEGGGFFITRFREVVEARLSDSELGVEDLAADMNLSRVQLYRKVKALTDSTPIELLRTARLNRAYQLLLTSELSISEIAYKVGFTSPSYFTKCFKDEYGKVPGEVRAV